MKRDVSLSLIRIVAIWMIVTFHFCCGTEKLVGSPFYGYANGGWGSVGTTIFFILSGYLFRLCHKEIPNVGQFYRKKFYSIYSLLWMSFAAAYLVQSILLSNFAYGGPAWKLIFSLVGIDTYLAFYQVQTYAVVGEWFTFVIILLYLLYPLLNILFKKHWIFTTAVLAALYFGNVLFNPFKVPPDANLITGIFMAWIGMILEKYSSVIKNHPLILLPCVLVSLLVISVKLPFFELPWKNLLGISIFLCLFILFGRIGEGSRINAPAHFLSNISYAVYLTHHFILNRMFERCQTFLTSGTRLFLFYWICMGMTLAVSVVLYTLNKCLSARKTII